MIFTPALPLRELLEDRKRHVDPHSKPGLQKLLVAPGLTASNKKLLVTKGIATGSKKLLKTTHAQEKTQTRTQKRKQRSRTSKSAEKEFNVFHCPTFQ